jgi:hypothetical protein
LFHDEWTAYFDRLTREVDGEAATSIAAPQSRVSTNERYLTAHVTPCLRSQRHSRADVSRPWPDWN